jgi:hypothetical protein
MKEETFGWFPEAESKRARMQLRLLSERYLKRLVLSFA